MTKKTIEKDWAELDDFIFSVSPEIHTADLGETFLLFIKPKWRLEVTTNELCFR
jgi:hypothetical protein